MHCRCAAMFFAVALLFYDFEAVFDKLIKSHVEEPCHMLCECDN